MRGQKNEYFVSHTSEAITALGSSFRSEGEFSACPNLCLAVVDPDHAALLGEDHRVYWEKTRADFDGVIRKNFQRGKYCNAMLNYGGEIAGLSKVELGCGQSNLN